MRFVAAAVVRYDDLRDESGAGRGTALDDTAARRANVVRLRAARSSRTCASIALAFALIPAGHASILVPAGGQYSTGGGQTDLSCTDVIVAGTLFVAGGALLNVRHLTVQPGGTIDGGSGTIQVGGNWSNGGTFVAGTSSVRFDDSCGLTSATVDGNTVFFNARFVSTAGKNYAFQAGTTQTIAGLLEILGTSAKPIQFRSNAFGQVANVNLVSQGTQSILHVGVTDVWATGQHLAPDQANEGGGGNALNWFGMSPEVVTEPIPALGDFALLALTALLAGSAVLNLRRRELPHRRTADRTGRRNLQ